MQHFSYTISSDYVGLAQTYFPRDYIEEIRQKNTYEQSLVGRYVVSQIVEENWGLLGFLPRVDEEGKPIAEGGIHWSISHSGKRVFVGVSSDPIGVDIEVIRPRDESLFGVFSEQEWNILGEKNWESFYILWSAKEALVKKYLGGMDEIGKWQLIRVVRVSDEISELSFSDGEKIEVVHSGMSEGVVRSWSG